MEKQTKAKKTLRWQRENAELLLLPERGRVLQATVGGIAAFWENPEPSGDWNVGGDRLWLSPEVDWHWKTLERADFTQYEVQAAVDPGSWAVEARGRGFCRVRQRAQLNHRHRDTTLTVEMIRCFSEVNELDARFFETWIGYRSDNELSLVDGVEGQRVGLWSLLQVPSPGVMMAGGSGHDSPRLHFGSLPKALCRRTGGIRTFRITGEHQYKVGLLPSGTNGRLAYVRESEDGFLVIFRQFFPQPWRRYCDRPMWDLTSSGDAVQFYNDSGEFGGFGELEYHGPMLEVGGELNRLTDSNLTIVGLVSAKNWSLWKQHWMSSDTGCGPTDGSV